jgi:hypothetical protein
MGRESVSARLTRAKTDFDFLLANAGRILVEKDPNNNTDMKSANGIGFVGLLSSPHRFERTDSPGGNLHFSLTSKYNFSPSDGPITPVTGDAGSTIHSIGGKGRENLDDVRRSVNQNDPNLRRINATFTDATNEEKIDLIISLQEEVQVFSLKAHVDITPSSHHILYSFLHLSQRLREKLSVSLDTANSTISAFEEAMSESSDLFTKQIEALESKNTRLAEENEYLRAFHSQQKQALADDQSSLLKASKIISRFRTRSQTNHYQKKYIK